MAVRHNTVEAMGKKKAKQRALEQELAAKSRVPSDPISSVASSSNPDLVPPMSPRSQLQYTRDIARIYWNNGVYDFRMGETTTSTPPVVPVPSSTTGPDDISSSSTAPPHYEDRPHKRPRRDSPTPTHHERESSQHRSDRRPRSPSPEFVPGLPSDAYLQISLRPSSPILSDPSPPNLNPKLLILDLNGTLVYRSPRNKGWNRTITPRPYMRPFTQWVTDPRSGLETMIWSSARPINVEKMARACFGEDGVEKLRAIWARDTLGLSRRDYERNVQTIKDLDLIWRKLPFSALNTILLDDSALKAHLQPYNHLILTEYDAQKMDLDRHFLALSDDPNFTATEQHPDTPVKRAHDQTLLAIIGILSEAVRQTNVAGWMRAGGLWSAAKLLRNVTLDPPPQPSPSSSPSTIKPPEPAELSSSPVQTKRKRDSTPEGRAFGDLPPSVPKLWFDDSAVFNEWISRGRSELERLNIPAVHGLGAKEAITVTEAQAVPASG